MVFRKKRDIQIETKKRFQSHMKCSRLGEKFPSLRDEVQIDRNPDRLARAR